MRIDWRPGKQKVISLDHHVQSRYRALFEINYSLLISTDIPSPDRAKNQFNLKIDSDA